MFFLGENILDRFLALFLVGFSLIFLGFISACGTGKTFQKGPVQSFPDTLVEKTTSWRGGAIGASLGSPIEGNITQISAQASREAAKEGRPTVYLSLDGFQRVETLPVGKSKSAQCRLVREKIFQEGKLIRDEIKEVCQ